MRGLNLFCLPAFLCTCDKLFSQTVYTIRADSVKITNCDSAELILENHTQNIPGFLFNTGNGRTIFKRAAQSLGNGNYLFGADTVQVGSPNAWLQGGNVGISSPSNYIDLFSIQNIGVDASPLSLSSGGYNGQLGVVIGRNSRSTLMTDPLLTVIESDTTVFQTLKNGNVGIGTGSPSAQLHTTGSVRFAGLTQDNTQANVLVSDADGNLYYCSASSLAAENPVRSSLAVNGTIKSHKIIISPDEWADYIFDSSYRLPELTEVESYIHREHHLPGIPSAAVVQQDSLDIGAGQAALLKKIEELTLYTIEQKKEIDSMKAQLQDFKKILADKTK